MNFWNGTVGRLVEHAHATGGTVLAPSAPGFATILDDPGYYTALRSADYVVLDSTLVALVCVLKSRKPVSRISGLRLLEYLLLREGQSWTRAAHILWVVPSAEEERRILELTATHGFLATNQRFYVAPFYTAEDEFADEALAAQIREHGTELIIICIGSGKQEKLAHRMRQMLKSCPPIVCIGAAISFLTGGQVRIPMWADRSGLGWLWRTLDNPKVFGARYFDTLWRLPLTLLRYRVQHGSLG